MAGLVVLAGTRQEIKTKSFCRTFGVSIPTARELVDWTQQRLKELLDAETEKDHEIPRDWRLEARSPLPRREAAHDAAHLLPKQSESRGRAGRGWAFALYQQRQSDVARQPW